MFVLLRWAAKIVCRKKAFFVAVVAAILAWQVFGEVLVALRALPVDGHVPLLPDPGRSAGARSRSCSSRRSSSIWRRRSSLPWFMLVFLVAFLCATGADTGSSSASPRGSRSARLPASIPRTGRSSSASWSGCTAR
ncbi:MAG: hypothetical protein MZU97_12730 [Bacillus subtilis]|nr:hypothetical protein [Bacillus subtilis]